MALQNGLMTGAQAQKLNGYPTVNGNADNFLRGNGTWAEITEATSVAGGFMSASDKAFLDALRTGQLATSTTNATTGALEYKYSDTVIFTIPVASGE